jgi:phenylacetate-CoA ligase
MVLSTREDRQTLARLGRDDLASLQLEKLNRLLDAILPANPFYAEKLAGIRRPIASLADFAALPFTHKDELVDPKRRDMAANLTWPIDRYVRFHRTSGTHGRPLAVLDTAEDWLWWIDGWQWVLDAAEIERADRVLMSFSFGPFIGFWSAHDAFAARGAMVIPSGGMSTIARLDLARAAQPTVLCSTPTYALHLLEAAAEHKIDVKRIGIRRIIVAGEPGGSLPAVRERLETGFGAKVIDHAGATEVGPWGFGDALQRGLFINESQFIAEFLSVENGEPISSTSGEGEVAELVLTALGRSGAPLLRYRTRDLVRPMWRHGQESSFVLLEGGILGRADDMLTIRGVNVFPSALQQILHAFPEIVEYRAIVTRSSEMDELAIEIEDHLNQPRRVAEELQVRLGLRAQVTCVPLGSLPRSEGKGKRLIDQR